MGTTKEERIGELTRRMLRKKLYIVLSKATAPPERIKEISADHRIAANAYCG